MKNYIIGALACIIMAMGTIIYKNPTNVKKNLAVQYPLELRKASPLSKSTENPKLYLYVFFSKGNCRDCLGIIEVLNELPPTYFFIKGVVPKREYNNIEEIRAITGATFPIESDQMFKGLIPQYTPALVGLSKKSDLFFIIPGVPGEKEYLESFLNSIYHKVYSYLVSLE
jgi:hypothetical protein